jgi:hypothetical protein
MLNAGELDELHRANPVSLDDARRLADELGLATVQPGAAEPQHRPRPRRLVWALAAAAPLAAVLFATPAWGLVRGILPFWDQPRAPQPVQIAFSELNLGFPPGMSPQAVSGETRDVGRFDFGGSTHTLWVAPAKNGGFCSLWLPQGGGGCSTSGKPLSTGALLRGGFPEWINGDAAGPAADVVIRFSDGATARPQVIWVSAPIDAGFFAYEVPAAKQTSRAHVTAVDAYDRGGRLLAHQTFAG